MRRWPRAAYKLVNITQVDTSTGVLTDVQALAAAARRARRAGRWWTASARWPARRCRMVDWGVDLAFTASQKAVSVPPGLALAVARPAALAAFKARETPVGQLLRRLDQLAADHGGVRGAQAGLLRHPGGQPGLGAERQPGPDPGRKGWTPASPATSSWARPARRASPRWGWARCRWRADDRRAHDDRAALPRRVWPARIC